MKKYALTALITFMMTTFVKSQNYLYNPGQSGFSIGAGLFSPDLKKLNGYSYHLDYTINGRVSFGISRSVFKTEYSASFNDKFSNLNLSFSPIKIQKPNSVFSTPLVFSYSESNDFGVISFGGGLSFINQINHEFKVIPLFLILYSEPTTSYRSGYLNFGFEINLIYKKFRLTPSFSLAETNSIFGIDAGIVL